MKPKINQRREGDKTRAAILKAAMKLFAEQGFSGTPTASIAKTAKVNEALIFHHFGNKADLWKKVKIEITKNSHADLINSTPPSLRVFLQEAVQQRLKLYDSNPFLHKIIQWQRLENKDDLLSSANPLAPNTWIPAMQYLQQNNQIKKSQSAELIVKWLVASINVMVLEEANFFHSKKVRSEYIELIIEGFELALKK